MKRNVEVNIEVSGIDLADELWEMNTAEQAAFLRELGRTSMFEFDFLQQLFSVAIDINKFTTDKTKAAIIKMLENTLEYIKEAGEDL